MSVRLDAERDENDARHDGNGPTEVAAEELRLLVDDGPTVVDAERVAVE